MCIRDRSMVDACEMVGIAMFDKRPSVPVYRSSEVGQTIGVGISFAYIRYIAQLRAMKDPTA